MKMLINSIVLFVSLITSNIFATEFDHSIFDSLLKKYVKNGLVNYKAFKENQTELNNYLNKIKQVDPGIFQKWSKDEQKAFWINAYNSITIEGILRNHPIQWGNIFARARFPQNSIRQIGGFWDEVFVKVMGKDITLNDIEHKILRKQFDDPRIHFVLVCASMGCPILESQAFFADDLEQRLEQVAQNFIYNSDKVRLDKEKNIIYLSAIFDWYKKDFRVSEQGRNKFNDYRKDEHGVMEFVTKYFSEADREFIIQNQPKIKYLDYDWSLNEKK